MNNRASLTKSLLAAIVIAAVAVAASAWPLYNMINVHVIRRDDIVVRIYRGSATSLTPINNASLTAIVFYPSPVNGSTIFQVVFNGSYQGTFYINPKALISWAMGWLKKYGPKAYLWLEPSIIFGVAYPLSNGSGPYVMAQLFAEPFNLSYPLQGKGASFSLVITHPMMVSHVNLGVTAKGSLRPSTAATTSTSPTSTPSTVANCVTNGGHTMVCDAYWLVPNVLAYYLNSSGVAPISIATIVASWNDTLTTTKGDLSVWASYLSVEQSGAGVSFLINAVSGDELSEAFEELGYDLGRLADVISSMSVSVIGPSITLSSSGTQFSYYNSATTVHTVPGNHEGNVGQLYVLGQVAFVNWTLEVYRLGEYLGTVNWGIGPVLTALVVNKTGSVAVPVIYYYVTNDTCTDMQLWAIGQANPHAYYYDGLDEVCPYPDLPAPVNWTIVYYLMRYTGSTSLSTGLWNLSYASLTGAPNNVGLPIEVGFTLEFILASAPGVDIPDWVALVLSAISVAPWTYRSTVLLSDEYFSAEATTLLNITGDLNVSYLYNYTKAFRLPPPVIYGTLLNAS